MWLIILQDSAAQSTPKIAQTTVLGILIASTLIVIGLLILIGIFARNTERALEYGNFFVVVLGILTALIGFLVAFPLLVSGVFDDPTQVLALLSALFGTIVGLVGTFFGIKTSSDARQDAQKLASDTQTLARDTLASDTTQPQISSTNPQDRAPNVPTDIHPSATFTKDMDDATINDKTFKLLETATLQQVNGRAHYEVPTRVAIFIPDAPLENGKTYGATITAGVKDRAGNALAQDHTWHFTIIGEGTVPASGRPAPSAAEEEAQVSEEVTEGVSASATTQLAPQTSNGHPEPAEAQSDEPSDELPTDTEQMAEPEAEAGPSARAEVLEVEESEADPTVEAKVPAADSPVAEAPKAEEPEEAEAAESEAAEQDEITEPEVAEEASSGDDDEYEER